MVRYSIQPGDLRGSGAPDSHADAGRLENESVPPVWCAGYRVRCGGCHDFPGRDRPEELERAEGVVA